MSDRSDIPMVPDVPELTLPALDPERTERALARLPYREREALLLKTRDGHTWTEVGAMLGLSQAEAKACVASALVRLHAELMPPERSWRSLPRRFWRCIRRRLCR